jgi:MutL protein
MTSAPKPAVESIIAVDIGSTLTKAALIDVVDGEYRILANADYPSTLEPPWSDVALAVQQCISRLEQITMRELLDTRGVLLIPEQESGRGVDAFVATASAAEPLRVAVAGLMRDYSVESARKATFATYALAESLISLDNEPGKDHKWELPERIAALHKQTPAVIVLVGGSDKGANAPLLDVASAVAMACATWPEPSKPDVIFAGNGAARGQIAELIGTLVPLSVVENVRPVQNTENLEPLENELETFYLERRLQRLPGFGKIAGFSTQPVVATARAFGAGVHALARHFELNVLGIDVGGATTTLAVSDHDRFIRVQRSDLGVSHNIENVAHQTGIANVLRWLPLIMSADEAWDRLANKVLRPFTLPETRKDLLLEQAIAREAMRLALAELMQRWQSVQPPKYPGYLPTVDLLVGAGGVLSHAPFPGQTVLLMLDALQPVSVVNLALDSGALLSQLSLIASVQPQAAAQLAGREGISALGTAICPIGPVRPGEVMVSYQITYQDGGKVSGEVHAGEIEVLPLASGQKADLELKPARQVDLGQGRGRTGITTAEGGSVGVIIDARGRPLLLSDDPEKCAALNQQWLYNVGA